jgi:hypothetical protein
MGTSRDETQCQRVSRMDEIHNLLSSINHLSNELSSVKDEVHNLRTDVRSILRCLEPHPSNTGHAGQGRGAGILHPEPASDQTAPDVHAEPDQPNLASRPMCPPEVAPAPSRVAAAATTPTARAPPSPVSPESTPAEHGRVGGTAASTREADDAGVPCAPATAPPPASTGGDAEHGGANPDASNDNDITHFWRLTAVEGEYHPRLAAGTACMGGRGRSRAGSTDMTANAGSCSRSCRCRGPTPPWLGGPCNPCTQRLRCARASLQVRVNVRVHPPAGRP